MAKRRAEECLLYESPSKRCWASCVDAPPDGVAPSGVGVSPLPPPPPPPSPPPPALLALLGSRCRKRPLNHLEDRHSNVERQTATTTVVTVMGEHASGSFQKRRVSSALDANLPKRARDDCKSLEMHVLDEDNKEKNTEDSIYNSFQFWRSPLPALDLSLLEGSSDDPQTKGKSKLKDPSYDAMET
ncbi:unnamed protein product [Ophioblennius macclurei]